MSLSPQLEVILIFSSFRWNSHFLQSCVRLIWLSVAKIQPRKRNSFTHNVINVGFHSDNKKKKKLQLLFKCLFALQIFISNLVEKTYLHKKLFLLLICICKLFGDVNYIWDLSYCGNNLCFSALETEKVFRFYTSCSQRDSDILTELWLYKYIYTQFP